MYLLRCLIGYLITPLFSLILWKRKVFGKDKVVDFQIKGYGVIKFSLYTTHFIKIDVLRNPRKLKGIKRFMPIRIELPTVKDPINLIFVGFTPDRVEHFLTKHGNWRRTGTSMQYLFIEGKWKPLISSFEYVYPSKREERYHIRIFEDKKNGIPITLVAAHQEYFDEIKQDHMIISWQKAEELVLRSFSTFKQLRTDRITRPNWRGYPSDGRASLIFKS